MLEMVISAPIGRNSPKRTGPVISTPTIGSKSSGHARYHSDGSSGLVANSIDYSVWGKLGNVRGFEGADGEFGTHDSGEDFDGTGLSDFPGWAGASNAGDVVKDGGNYYQARIKTTNAPSSAGNENDWHFLGSSLATAKKHYYTDTDYWEQVTIGNFSDTDYWEQVTETIIQSSQDLGTIDVTKVLGSANFKSSLAGLTERIRVFSSLAKGGCGTNRLRCGYGHCFQYHRPR